MVALCDHPLDPEMGLREPAAREAQKALDTFDILGSVAGRSRIVFDELRPKIHLRASKSFWLNAFSQNWTTLLLFNSSWVSSPARANVLSSASMNEAATITGMRPCERSGSWWALFLADVLSVDRAIIAPCVATSQRRMRRKPSPIRGRRHPCVSRFVTRRISTDRGDFACAMGVPPDRYAVIAIEAPQTSHSGAMQSIEPGISRFRFALRAPRNDRAKFTRRPGSSGFRG